MDLPDLRMGEDFRDGCLVKRIHFSLVGQDEEAYRAASLFGSGGDGKDERLEPAIVEIGEGTGLIHKRSLDQFGRGRVEEVGAGVFFIKGMEPTSVKIECIDKHSARCGRNRSGREEIPDFLMGLFRNPVVDLLSRFWEKQDAFNRRFIDGAEMIEVGGENGVVLVDPDPLRDAQLKVGRGKRIPFPFTDPLVKRAGELERRLHLLCCLPIRSVGYHREARGDGKRGEDPILIRILYNRLEFEWKMGEKAPAEQKKA